MLGYDAWRKRFCLFFSFLLTAGSDYLYLFATMPSRTTSLAAGATLLE